MRISIDQLFADRALVEVKKKDFLGRVVDRMKKGGFKAGSTPSTYSDDAKPAERAKETDRQGAEREASAAKARADAAVKASAAKASETKSAQQKRADTIAKSRKAQMKAALAAEKEKRQQKKAAKAAKKASTVSTGTATPEPAKADGVNAQLAHCMLALHFKKGKDTRAAWNICRASLTKYGYFKPPYREDGKVKDLRSTQKGSKRAMQHAFEKHPLNGGIRGTPAEKFQKFRKLFRDIEPTV